MGWLSRHEFVALHLFVRNFLWLPDVTRFCGHWNRIQRLRSHSAVINGFGTRALDGRTASGTQVVFWKYEGGNRWGIPCLSLRIVGALFFGLFACNCNGVHRGPGNHTRIRSFRVRCYNARNSCIQGGCYEAYCWRRRTARFSSGISGCNRPGIGAGATAQAPSRAAATGGAEILPAYARAQRHRSLKQSSHDATGGNRDFFPVKAGATQELFNQQGPGAITHIWFTISAKARRI